jgi:hypothetical protein
LLNRIKRREKRKHLRLIKGGASPVVHEPRVSPPSEQMFTAPIAVVENSETPELRKVDREEHFPGKKCLHVAYDYPDRYELEVKVIKKTYKVETLTNIDTGKAVRASMVDDGPAGTSFTWNTIALLIKMHVGFIIPLNRIELMLDHRAFRAGKIYNTLCSSAHKMLPVYIHLSDQLAEASIIGGDDTPTHVIQLDEDIREEKKLHQILDEELGWQSERLDGEGFKKTLNVSFLSGRTENDPRSTIQFFRTHFGSVGNLLTKLLEKRSPQNKEIILQTDLSTTNLPSEEMRKKFRVTTVGCAAHARRDFWRYREDDDFLSYFLLRGFALLSGLEKRIDRQGRTSTRVVKLRTKFGQKIWNIIRDACQKTMGTSPKPNTDFRVWPPDSRVFKAARYVDKNFTALTLYLKDPRLEYTNNHRERGLRPEKAMLDSSFFRQTRNGRAVLDVLRTINASCTTAEIDLADYLRYVLPREEAMQDNPEAFTPFKVAEILRSQRDPLEIHASAS